MPAPALAPPAKPPRPASCGALATAAAAPPGPPPSTTSSSRTLTAAARSSSSSSGSRSSSSTGLLALGRQQQVQQPMKKKKKRRLPASSSSSSSSAPPAAPGVPSLLLGSCLRRLPAWPFGGLGLGLARGAAHSTQRRSDGSAHAGAPTDSSSGGSSSCSGSDCEDDDENDDATAATSALSSLSLLGASPLAAAAAAAAAGGGGGSMLMPRVASDASDLSGYIIGADASSSSSSSQRSGSSSNVVVLQMECPRCQCIDRCAPTDLDAETAAAVAAALSLKQQQAESSSSSSVAISRLSSSSSASRTDVDDDGRRPRLSCVSLDAPTVRLGRSLSEGSTDGDSSSSGGSSGCACACDHHTATSSEAASEEYEEEEKQTQASPSSSRSDGARGRSSRAFYPHASLAWEVFTQQLKAEQRDRPTLSCTTTTTSPDASSSSTEPTAAAEATAAKKSSSSSSSASAATLHGGKGSVAGGLPSLMRAVIVDWVLDIHARLRLCPQSLYLAVLILDRFTSQVPLDRPALQLLALAALLVASKHEDVTAPSIKTMLRFTENFPGGSPPKAELLEMERRVLQVLGFSFARPTAADFLDTFLALASSDTSTSTSTSSSFPLSAVASTVAGAACTGNSGIAAATACPSSSSSGNSSSSMSVTAARARYFAERALFDGEVVGRFAPSRIAAGAVYLARRHETPDAWTPELEQWSGYSEQEAERMAGRIARLAQEPLPLVGTRRLTALTRKYASTRYREVSTMSCVTL